MHILASQNVFVCCITEGNSGLRTTSSCSSGGLSMLTPHRSLNVIVTAGLGPKPSINAHSNTLRQTMEKRFLQLIYNYAYKNTMQLSPRAGQPTRGQGTKAQVQAALHNSIRSFSLQQHQLLHKTGFTVFYFKGLCHFLNIEIKKYIKCSKQT